MAALMLDYLIAGKTVRCRSNETDRYGRDLATCLQGEINLNAVMVLSGQAVAYRQYSDAYVEAEKVARKARVGLWATEFEVPWDYRKNRK